MEEIEIWHILPVNDSEKHEESSMCSCEPTVDISNEYVLIIHNSFDGREAVEWANEILNNKKAPN